MIFLYVTAMAASVANQVEYECIAEKQVALMSKGDTWTYNTQDVPKAQRETFSYVFTLSYNEDGSRSVSHDPGIVDVLGLGGSHEVISIAPNQFAFTSMKIRNCLFTEQACSALVEISDVSKKEAMFTLTPTGSVKNANGTRSILQMIMLGRCKRNEVTR